MKITSDRAGTFKNLYVNGTCVLDKIQWHENMSCEDNIGLVCDGNLIYEFSKGDKWKIEEIPEDTCVNISLV